MVRIIQGSINLPDFVGNTNRLDNLYVYVN